MDKSFSIAEVFSTGVWPLLSNLEDPELQRLARELPAVVLSSRADSTTKKYLGAYRRWKAWADSRQGVPSFPVRDIHLALYMQHLSESSHSKAAVEEVVHALSWLHKVAGMQAPSDSPLVQSVMEGFRRLLAKPKCPKEPVSVEMLQAMVEAAGPSPSLTEVRLLAICLVAFTGFLRCDELTRLRCKDVTFNDHGMVINVVSSKTDQFREGASLVIARTGAPTCPVSMMQKYFKMAGLCHTADKLFRGIVSTRKGECLRRGGGLSYTRMRELLLAKIEQLGMDPKQFGMHSLRAGLCTCVFVLRRAQWTLNKLWCHVKGDSAVEEGADHRLAHLVVISLVPRPRFSQQRMDYITATLLICDVIHPLLVKTWAWVRDYSLSDRESLSF